MSRQPERRHSAVTSEEEHGPAKASIASQGADKKQEQQREHGQEQAETEQGRSATEAASSPLVKGLEAPGAAHAGGSAAHARSPRRGRRRSSEQQRTQQHAVSAAEHTAAEEYVAAPSPKSSPAKASEVSPFPATGVPPVSTGAVPGVPPLLPLPAGRPPLPPAELLRAQLAFAPAAATDVGRAGPVSTAYPSLEALAAAGSAAEGVGTSGGGEGVDTDEGDVMSQGKRKASAYDAAEELSETEGEGGIREHREAGGRGHKKPRLVWTAELHARFMNAVTHLGVKNAVPKTILQLMNVEGMTRENVASHLQKYRLYLKRLAGYPSAARLPLDTLQQVQQAIQQQGHPPLFQQHGMGTMGGVGFPAFMQPPPMGGASGGPQQPQWGHMGGPSLGEGTAAPETSLPMSMHPWLAMQGGYGGAVAFPHMGSFGQPPGNFPGPEAAPCLPFGWVWGLGSPGTVPNPGGLPPQPLPGQPASSTPTSGPGPSAAHVEQTSLVAAVPVGGRPTATEGGPSAGESTPGEGHLPKRPSELPDRPDTQGPT